jgi:nitrogen fixation protein NifB
MAAGVETITVTVNAVDPRILVRLNRGVSLNNRFLGGLAGAEFLLSAQERGLKLAHQNHLTIKVNTVLVPGLNDGHVGQIAQRVKSWGADLMNVIPLIPSGDLAHMPEPSDLEKDLAMRAAEKHLPVKRNCRRCRADACGIPGLTDYSKELYGDLGPLEETFSHG